MTELVVIVSFFARVGEYQSLLRFGCEGNVVPATEILIHSYSRDGHAQLAETLDWGCSGGIEWLAS